MKKHARIIIITAFCSILLSLGALSIILPDKDISKSERRYLTQFPTLTWQTVTDGAFMQNIEKYLPDQFPFREGFRSVKAIFERLTLRLDTSDVYEYNGYLTSLDFTLHESLVKKAGEKLTKVKNELLSDGNTAYIALIPPKNYYIAQSETCHPTIDYENLQSILYESCGDFKTIDLFDTLTLEDYYKTDSHWRQEQLGKAVEKLTSAMGVGQYLTETYETHEIHGFRGVYSGQSALPVDDEVMYYLTNDAISTATVTYKASDIAESTVYTLSKSDGTDMYDIFLGGAVPVVEIVNPNAQSDAALVIFRDSYGSSIAPLLIECYRKITLVDLRYIALDYLPQFAETDNADFLFLYSTGVINNSEMLRV